MQKTAYEMRISDWSSDVCSSDLLETTGGARSGEDLRHLVNHARRMRTLMHYVPRRYDPVIIEALAMAGALDPQATRSEEHTSELQSLMRISYAVFCLKKKTSFNR